MSNLINMRIGVKVFLRQGLIHNGESSGANIVSFRRVKYKISDGKIIPVPVYSGNALRGALRDCGFLYLRNVLNLTEKIHPRPFHLLTGGGALTDTKKTTPEEATSLESLYQLLPLLSMFGVAVGNRITHSRWDDTMFLPMCSETAPFIPEGVYDVEQAPSIYDIMENVQYVRHDDGGGNVNSDMLYVPQDGKKEEPQQMIYNIETMIAGSELYGEIQFNYATHLEVLALVSALKAFSHRPVLGGVGRIGHGRSDFFFDNGWQISANAVNLPDTSEYDEFLLANKDAILKVLYG